VTLITKNGMVKSSADSQETPLENERGGKLRGREQGAGAKGKQGISAKRGTNGAGLRNRISQLDRARCALTGQWQPRLWWAGPASLHAMRSQWLAGTVRKIVVSTRHVGV